MIVVYSRGLLKVAITPQGSRGEADIMTNYKITLKIFDQLEEHASGKCQCDNPEECADAMARVIKEGARALHMITAQTLDNITPSIAESIRKTNACFTPAQRERAAGRVWMK